jgi:hypothetical protein
MNCLCVARRNKGIGHKNIFKNSQKIRKVKENVLTNEFRYLPFTGSLLKSINVDYELFVEMIFSFQNCKVLKSGFEPVCCKKSS